MSGLMRVLAALVVAGVVFGGSAYFAYELFWKPKKEVAAERRAIAEATPAPPPPHPGAAVWQTAQSALAAGRDEEAREALAAIVAMPDAPMLADAKAALGKLNTAALFSPTPGAGKTAYTVVRSDSLSRIAARTGAKAELIYKVNNLTTINLQIGQLLMIPSIQIAGVLDRGNRTLTLANHGAFFKEYQLRSAAIPGVAAGSPVEARVADTIASKDGKRVAFGDKDFPGSERKILLTPGGAILRAMPAGAAEPPPGVVLSPSDLEEVFVLVTRGTPVTIR